MTRTRRTPTQIATDLAIKASEAASRAKLADATTDPVLAPVANALKRARTTLSTLKREFTETNPNSYGNRRMAFELRLAEIDAAESLAMAQLSDAEYLVNTIKSDFDAFSESMAAGDTITDMVESVVAGYGLPKHEALENAVDKARCARKSYKASVLPKDDELEMTAGA